MGAAYSGIGYVGSYVMLPYIENIIQLQMKVK